MTLRMRFDFTRDLCAGFADPSELVQARSLAEVIPALKLVEQAAGAGLWAAGYVAYEAAGAFDPALITLAPSNLPLVCFGLFESPVSPGAFGADFTRLPQPTEGARPFRTSAWKPELDWPGYRVKIDSIRTAEENGELYQANFTFPLRASCSGDPYAGYLALSRSSRCGFAAYLEVDDAVILSLSPELFFRCEGRRITTRPMKGTRRRGLWPDEDSALREELLHSEKDRAENIMVVDLLRNDLGRLAAAGTVRTPELFSIERYPSVWQMTSTVTAEMRPGIGLCDVLRSLFPSGSITGAPKIAAMKLISSVERTPRGVYCGSIGIVKPGGDSVFSVAIRTMAVDTARSAATYSVGGGITWYSSAEDEYQEALAKATAVTEAPPEFELLETMRLENGAIHQLERHLNRMQRSADCFDRPFERTEACSALNSCMAAAGSGWYRIRLLLNAEGRFRTEISPLSKDTGEQFVRLADWPIDRRNRFIYHKTTHRSFHPPLDDAVFDVLLYNEDGEVTEFTRGNVLIELDGALVTPPVRCGLLPGVLRQAIIDGGEAVESVVLTDQLKRASRIWFINSLRGRLPVTVLR